MTSSARSRLLTFHAAQVGRAVRDELRAIPTLLWAWFGLLGLFLLIGGVAAIRALFPGDKAIGTSPTYEWGLLIVGYVFFAITTSGLCLASSLGTVFGVERFLPLERRHAVLAILTLTTAFGIIALDLHYPVRLVFGAMLNPSPSSPMWWMGVFYGIYFGCLLVEAWSMFFGHHKIHGYACMFSSVMAVIAPSTLGLVFGVLAARAFWSGPFTVLLMTASAFLSGTALLGLAFSLVHRLNLSGYRQAAPVALPAIRLLLTAGLLLVSLLVAREVLVGYWATDPGLARATRALVAGPLAWQFWGLRVAGGLIVPFVLIATPRTRTPGWTGLASALSIAGVFTDRLTFVAAGQIAPVTAVAGVVSAPYAVYSPSPVEIGILIGAVGFIASGYTLAERYLDLSVIDVHALLSPASVRGYRDTVAAWRRKAASYASPQEAGGVLVLDAQTDLAGSTAPSMARDGGGVASTAASDPAADGEPSPDAQTLMETSGAVQPAGGRARPAGQPGTVVVMSDRLNAGDAAHERAADGAADEPGGDGTPR